VFATYKGQRHQATPYGDSELRFDDKRSYPTLSAAAQAITGRPTNGWTFWKTERDGKTVALATLRDELLALESEHIRSDQLRLSHIPAVDAPWTAILPFALRFDGYAFVGGGDNAVEEAQERGRAMRDRWLRDGRLPDTLDELRLGLFAEERHYKWTDMTGGDPEHMDFIRALLARIRELL
jgi:hypothetical protein